MRCPFAFSIAVAILVKMMVSVAMPPMMTYTPTR
jgi:hypothetical protein